MERWQSRVALVTGASAGIGAALVERLVKEGLTVVGCARNVQPIQELAEKLSSEKGKLFAIKCDLTKEEEILAMFETIKSKHGGVDICINNAGLSHPAPLFSGSSEQWRNMLDVNVMALCIVSREAFKSMRERNVDDGQIIHVSSLSGHFVMPRKEAHFYAATKFAVQALLEGMRHEIRATKTHIRIAAVSPGVVETEFAYRMSGDEVAKSFYSRYKCLEATDVVEAVVYVLSAPIHVAVHEVMLRPTEEPV